MDSSFDNNRRNRQYNRIGNPQPMNRNGIQRQRNDEYNNNLKITAEAYHLQTKGELVLNLKNGELVWTLKGEKSQFYKKDVTKFSIFKDNIKFFNKSKKDDRYILRLELKEPKNEYYIFSFQDRNGEATRDKFYQLLSKDYFQYYKNEFQMFPIEQQKIICLLLNNRFLFRLYFKLKACNNNIDRAWKFIRYRYPEYININLGSNNIQLSRDEELIMLAERKYNITKLINSDSNIYKSYIKEKNIKNENFWPEFIERQRGNNTYLLGGYKPSICDFKYKEKNKEKRTINELFEDLEKDTYYYDNYETNYLYYNENMKNEQNKIKENIKLLNDYSMNKIKDINYFTYSSLCMNLYKNNKKNNKDKKNSNVIDKNNKEEIIEIDINNSNYKNRLTKDNLLKKLKNMEIEYHNEKNDNSSFSTMKAINKENHYYYNLAKFISNKISADKTINSILTNYIFLIKDLALEQSFEFFILEKSKKEGKASLSPQKAIHNDRIMKQIIDNYNNEINNIFQNLKTKIAKMKEDHSFNSECILNYSNVLEFLLNNAKRSVEKLIKINK